MGEKLIDQVRNKASQIVGPHAENLVSAISHKLGTPRFERTMTKTTDDALLRILISHGYIDHDNVADSIPATMQSRIQELARLGQFIDDRAASEHELFGRAAGKWFAGKKSYVDMQNTGFGSALDGLVFARTYGIPVLALVGYRGVDEDSEPHVEMGNITDKLIHSAMNGKNIFGDRHGYGLEQALLDGITKHEEGETAVVLISPHGFEKKYRAVLQPRPEYTANEYNICYEEIKAKKGKSLSEVEKIAPISRDEAMEEIVHLKPNALILDCNGYDARAAQGNPKVDRKGNFYNTAYMGGTAYIGAAIAEANPHLEVVVIDGDQNWLMSQADKRLATNYPANLKIYVLDNATGSSVGVATSRILPPWAYDLAEVIRTIPDEPGTFEKKYKRVGAHGVYFDTEEAMELARLIGPLPAHARMVKEWIREQTMRNIVRGYEAGPNLGIEPYLRQKLVLSESTNSKDLLQLSI
jgi:sulfopyruvate decarboxylase TPP-binding subunit